MLRFAKRNNVQFVKLATIFGFDLMKKGRRPRLCLHVAWIISTDVVWEENCVWTTLTSLGLILGAVGSCELTARHVYYVPLWICVDTYYQISVVIM